MKKRANVVFGTIILIIVVILAAIMYMFAYNTFSGIKDDVLGDLNLQEAKDVVTEVDTRFPSWADGAIAFIFVGIWIAGLVSVLTKDEHPIIFGVMMFVLIFVVIAGAMLGNSFEEMFGDSDLSSLTSSFPMSYWLCTHMLEIGIVVGASILLAMLGKNKL